MAKSPTTLQYLDRAMAKLRELGLLGGKSDPVPVITLLDQISDLDSEKVTAIARTLDQASYFNEVVRDQVSGFRIGERYEGITTAFNSIRDDAKALVDQFEDGKISTMERMQNGWMKMTRGTIAKRFGKIKALYLDVAVETKIKSRASKRSLTPIWISGGYEKFRSSGPSSAQESQNPIGTGQNQSHGSIQYRYGLWW